MSADSIPPACKLDTGNEHHLAQSRNCSISNEMSNLVRDNYIGAQLMRNHEEDLGGI
jgi:hypothetical protein